MDQETQDCIIQTVLIVIEAPPPPFIWRFLFLYVCTEFTKKHFGFTKKFLYFTKIGFNG